MRWVVYVPVGIVVVAVLVLGYLLSMSQQSGSESASSARLGSPLPAFELTSLTDESVVLENSDLQGEPFLLNVWGSWCPSCRIEHPMLNELAESGVRIIGLNYRDTREGGQQWLADRGDPYEVSLFDPRGHFGFELGVVGAPETYVVDADGTIRYRHVGILNERHWAGNMGELYRSL